MMADIKMIMLDLINKNESFLPNTSLSDVFKLEREKEKIKINEYISSKAMEKNLAEVSLWIDSLEESARIDSKLTKKALKRFNKWNKSIGELEKVINFTDSNLEEIHNLRLIYKKVHYVQTLIKFFDEHAKWALPELKKKQDILGNYCDIVNNIEILKDLNSKYDNIVNMQYQTGLFTGYQLSYKDLIINQSPFAKY